MKTKDVLQRVEVDATPPPPVSSISVEISLDVTPGGVQVATLVAAERTKKNAQRWVVKKHGSQISELDQLKLKVVVLHDGIGEEIHKTRPIGFVAAVLKTIDLVA